MTHPYPPQAEQFCGNCRYERGCLCLRYAPRPQPRGQNKHVWPVVDFANWCGEWAPQEVPA